MRTKSLIVILLLIYTAWEMMDLEAATFWPSTGAPLLLGAACFALIVWLVALGVRQGVGKSGSGGGGLGSDGWGGGGDCGGGE